MKHNYSYTLFSLCLAGYGLISPSLQAADTNFVKLLDNVIQYQPEQQIIKGIQEQHSASQSLSKSLLAGDIDVIIHHENDSLTDNDNYQNWQVGIEFPIWLSSQKNAQKRITSSYNQEVNAQQVYLRWLASNTLRKLAWQYKNAKIELDAAHSSLKESFTATES